MKTVITYGTFDLFHIGHLNLLKRLSKMGNRLIVGVSTDEFNLVKGKKTIIPFSHRMEIVQSIKYVDMAFPESNWDQKVGDIKKYQANLFVMGDDWAGRFDYLKDFCEVEYLSRTAGISTTELKSGLSSLQGAKFEELRQALEMMNEIVKQFG